MNAFDGSGYESLGAVFCRAPAKVNLTLAVLGRRPDGYHDIESWAVTVGWFDHLIVRPAERLSLTVRGDAGDLGAESSNLAWRAADALAKAAGISAGAEMELDKAIPIGAGLGGGSSDAAAALWALNRAWRLNWPIEKLAAVGATIGSDVSFFLAARSCLMRGRGERVEPLQTIWRGWLAIVIPPFPCSTAAVYQQWDGGQVPAAGRSEPWTSSRAKSRELAEQLFNDLQPAAFRCEPRLAAVHSRVDGLEGRRVHMTGSGSGLFAIFDTREEATDWAGLGAARLAGTAQVCVVASL